MSADRILNLLNRTRKDVGINNWELTNNSDPLSDASENNSYHMDLPVDNFDVLSLIRKYRVHLFVFFLVFFIGLTLAHPAILLNDEFITANQVRQIHAGHQFMVNEGRYGLAENGTMSGYFANKGDLLGYTLFLPMLSQPAFKIIDITGEQFAYFILIFWAVMALLLLLFVNRFFREFSYIGKWQWTKVMACAVFLLFFVNLYYYSTFTVDDINSYPEILSIVFTNLFLLALSAMLIYEICRTVFEDTTFSFFAAIVCITSSSYFLWSTFCKDHILVLACFVPIVLALVRFVKTDEYWYLPMAFIGCGLVAWARPEVALWTALLVLCICGYTIWRFRSQHRPGYPLMSVVLSPLFTFIGALPFFVNNYVTTGNIFLPTESLYLHGGGNESAVMNASQPVLHVTGVNSLTSVIFMHIPTIPHSPSEIITDLGGIAFAPATGNVGMFTLVPLFFVMAVIGGILLLFKKIYFAQEEKRLILILLLASGAVFLAYASQLHSLNTDGGIGPDIRYLSPLYFTLTLTGLILVRKINVLPENPADTLREFGWITLIGIPVSLILLGCAYHMNTLNFSNGNIPLGKFFSFYVIALIILTPIILFSHQYGKCRKEIATYLILLLCAVPFFWQVNLSLICFSFSAFAGHIFWIPVIRMGWELFLYLIMLH